MLNNTQKFRLRMLASVCCCVVGIDLLCDPQETEALGHLMTSSRVSFESHDVQSSRVFLMSERASSNMIGTIMTLLASFDEAGVLPPEGTAQANQIIHGLIQLQSTLMKSDSVELADYQRAAEVSWRKHHQDIPDGVLKEEGLSLRMLEALIVYDREHPMWNLPKIRSAMQMFNVSQADWLVIVKLFNKANEVFRAQGRSMHAVYDAWRLQFPGGRP